MAWYTYPPMVAVASDGSVVPEGSGLIYDVNDVSATTPLAMTDVSGTTLTDLEVSGALVNGFRAEQPEVMWRSGGYSVHLVSPQGYRDIAEAARVLAADSANAAQTALNILEESPQILPGGGEPGMWLQRGATERSGVWAPAPIGSGSGLTTYAAIRALADYPPTFPPDGHNHAPEEITNSTAIGRAVLTALTKQAAREAIDAAPGSTQSWPGNGTTADKTAAGNHSHGAGAISYQPGSGPLTAVTVQGALDQLASGLGSGSGSGSNVIVYTYRSGGWPTMPATKPAGAQLVIFVGPGQPTSVPAWIGVASNQVPPLYAPVSTS